jgi:hypothetical protein
MRDCANPRWIFKRGSVVFKQHKTVQSTTLFVSPQNLQREKHVNFG